ncbi:MAG: extracellular solute-binding protein [bacterium]|nr:extracellular solute-binding protein [bacterium]
MTGFKGKLAKARRQQKNGLLLIVIFLAAFLAGCADSNNLSIITYNSEFKSQGIVADFEKKYNVKVDLQIIPTEQYQAKILPLLKTGKGVPDVFVGEAAWVKQFLDGGYWEDLNKAPYNAKTKDSYPYVVQMGTDKGGVLRALSWQATPGGWFYRRSVARKYFGTDDPAKIGQYFSSWDAVMRTAAALKAKSKGKVKMFAGTGETIYRPFYSARKIPWINDKNEFSIDPQMIEYFKIIKAIRDNDYDAKISDWSGPFFSAMNSKPDEATVFVYGWPTWGLFFVLSEQSDSKGDWAVTAPPSPFFWGGTWMGIYKNSKKKELAWKFIQMLTQDKAYMEAYAKKTGDFMSDKTVVDKIKSAMSSPVINGQNHYQYFADQVKYIDSSAISGDDYQINQMVGQLVNEYLNGKYDLAGLITTLGQRVKQAYPQVTIK